MQSNLTVATLSNHLKGISSFFQMHKLSDRQYTWTCLLARAKRFQWKDCEDLIITKGWLGGKKTKASIDPEKVVNALHNFGAPSNVLQSKPFLKFTFNALGLILKVPKFCFQPTSQ